MNENAQSRLNIVCQQSNSGVLLEHFRAWKVPGNPIYDQEKPLHTEWFFYFDSTYHPAVNLLSISYQA